MSLVHYWRLAQVQVDPNQIEIPKGTADAAKIATAFQYFFAITAAVTLLMIIYGGLKYVLSRGEPEAIAKSKGTVLYAIIGLIICISAFSIVTFVAGRLK